MPNWREGRMLKFIKSLFKKQPEEDICKYVQDGKCFIDDMTDKYDCTGKDHDLEHCGDYQSYKALEKLKQALAQDSDLGDEWIPQNLDPSIVPLLNPYVTGLFRAFWHGRYIFELNINKITNDWGPLPNFNTYSFDEDFKY